MDNATSSASAATISSADILATRALLQRVRRPTNHPAELQAIRELTSLLSHDPCGALRRCLEIARTLCNAGTAGLSLVQNLRSGITMLQWQSVSGALADHEGVQAPRDASMCGLCLDEGMTILLAQPERKFAYLKEIEPSVIECLMVPLYDHSKRALGTLWIAHHDTTASFCANDALILEQLASQAVLALKMLEQARQHHEALILLESNEQDQQIVALGVVEQRHALELAEISATALRQALVFKETEIQEVHHRVANSLQTAASLMMLQARAATAAEVAVALRVSYGRLHLLAKAHQLLYRSSNAQQILMPKLLQAMGDALWQSFAEMSAQVNLKIVAEPISLSPDDAIPMALLANEIMTNAYKHAFPGGCAGEITVSLWRARGNEIILQITDDGVGMNDKNNASGLGVELIHGLANQMRGTLSFDKLTDAPGTCITLTIHRPINGDSKLEQAAAASAMTSDSVDAVRQLTHASTM